MTPDPEAVLAALDDLLARTPVEDLAGLLHALHARQGTALSRLQAKAWKRDRGSNAVTADENLSVQEAAQRLGVSKSWLYQNHQKLKFTVRIGRRVLFSARGLESWNRRRQGV